MTEPLKFTYIRDITLNMKNLNCQFIVLDVPPARKTKDGYDVRTIRVADKSGSINFAVWNEIGACLFPGDICRLINGYASSHKLCLTLNCGKLGELQKVGEFCMLFTEVPNMSAPNSELVKVEQQQKPPTGDNNGGGGGNFGSGGPSSGGNGSSGPPAKIPRMDGFQTTKSNGAGQSQTSRKCSSAGPFHQRKRKFLLENPENFEQNSNAKQNMNYSFLPPTSSYDNLHKNTKTQQMFNEDFSLPPSNVKSYSNTNLNVNFLNEPVLPVENLLPLTYPNGGGWFKPMSRMQAEKI